MQRLEHDRKQLAAQVANDRDIKYVDGKPRPMTFTVGLEHAAACNAALQQLRSRAAAGTGDEPFFDFNHEDGAASGHPTELYWAGDDLKTGGIRARGAWTGSGRAALTGRDYRRFSPQWEFDEATQEPTGVELNLGGLVNRAAFRKIQALAKDGHKAKGEEMTREEFIALLNEGLKPIIERVGALETTTAAAKASTAAGTAQAAGTPGLTEEKIVKLFDDRLKPITERLQGFETQQTEGRKAMAKAAVQAHVARGAIAPEDTKSVQFWETAHLADAASAEQQMVRLPGKALARLTTNGHSAATAAAAAAAASAEPENQFIAKAKDYGKAQGIKGEADALIAFGRTAEGAALYEAYREKISAKG